MCIQNNPWATARVASTTKINQKKSVGWSLGVSVNVALNSIKIANFIELPTLICDETKPPDSIFLPLL